METKILLIRLLIELNESPDYSVYYEYNGFGSSIDFAVFEKDEPYKEILTKTKIKTEEQFKIAIQELTLIKDIPCLNI